MAYETIEVRVEAEKVGVITLNRPKQLNALNDQLMDELGDALKKFDADKSIGCMIITGSERAFAAGADFEMLRQRQGEGWRIQTTTLSENYDLDQMTKRLGEPGSAWLLIGAITPDGAFRLYSGEQTFTPEKDWTVLYFAPPTKRESKETGDAKSDAKVPG